MKKRVKSLALSVVLTLLAVFLLQENKVAEAADNLLLLEKRHPDYWNYLSPDKMIEVQTISEYQNVPVDKIAADNVLFDFIQGNVGGIDISINDAGWLKFIGTATEDIWPSIANTSYIASGTYFATLGNEYSPNVSAYIEAYKGNTITRLADLYAPQFLYIDASQYDFIKYTVSIKKGTTVDFSLLPVVYKVSNEKMETDKVAMWINVPDDLSPDDWTIFNRRINKLKSYSNVVVRLHSGITKLYDDQWVDAKVDELGRLTVINSNDNE